MSKGVCVCACECPRVGVFFQFFGGRMTSRGQCPRGVLVNVQERGCFSIFWRADDVTRTMSKGGGVLVNVFTPPLQEILYPRLCSTYPSSDPPPPGWLATGLSCVCFTIVCIQFTLSPRPPKYNVAESLILLL